MSDRNEKEGLIVDSKEFRPECVTCEHLVEGEKFGAAACDIEKCIYE